MMRVGIDMLFISGLTNLVCQLLFHGLQALLLFVPSGQVVQLNMAATVVMGFVLVISGLCAFVALLLCCTLPVASAPRSLGIATRICLLATLLVGLCLALLIALAIGAHPRNPSVAFLVLLMLFFGLLAMLLALASWVMVFMVFAGVARDLGNRKLGSQFISYLVLSLLLTLFQVVATSVLLRNIGPDMLLGQKVPRGMEEVMQILRGFQVMMAIVGAGLMIWFLILLNSLARLLAPFSRPTPPATI